MKKILIGALVALGVGAIAVVGVAYLRPDMLPKLGAARAKVEKDDYGLFCKEHGVPEKFCTLCHPELKEKLLLCPEHGNIPEDICTKCHPENAEKYDIKPCEHGLPSHFCTKCHPENFKEGGSASAGPALINDGWCAEFGEKGPDGKVKYCKLLPMVRLASAGLAGDIGLKTAQVIEEEHAHELIANAETAYDANRYAEITARVAGFLREVRLDLGQRVKADEVLVVIDSSEVSTAKTQYLTSNAALGLDEDSYRRAKYLTDQKIIGNKQEIATRTAMNQAQMTLWNSEQKLKNFRFDDASLSLILKTNDTSPLIETRTPIGGTVIFRHAVMGEAIEPTTKLFTVADTSKMWLWIDVYERDIARVKEGQPVTFAVSGLSPSPEEAGHVGRVTWVGAEVDEKTRTTKVRAEVPNPAATLRANQYGKARIRVEEPHRALTVSKAAVQRYENADLVFLVQEGASYRPQRIKTRSIDRKDVVEVAWGLKPGQEVVTDGSFLLKTEIMKGSIGAGCCD
jgi:membrane fusion protein, heavy metal efflux system